MKIFSRKNKEYGLSMEEVYKDRIESTIEGKEFSAADKFDSAIFKGKLFKKCKFNRVEFRNMVFENTYFSDCTFMQCKFIGCKMNYMSNLVFEASLIHMTNFENCHLTAMLIKNSRLKSVSFNNTSLYDSILAYNCYYSTTFVDNCDLRGTHIFRSSGWMDISFINENSYSKMNLKTYIQAFDFKDLHHVEGCKKVLVVDSTLESDVSNTFFSFYIQFLKNDLVEKSGECFYLSKVSKHKGLKYPKKIWSFLSWISCGYGEKPFMSFIVSLFIIFSSGLLYMFNGIRMEDTIINYNLFSGQTVDWKTSLYDFGQCLHFSLVTFATVGYGNVVPAGIISLILSSVEILLGVTMIAVFTSTLVRKMTR